MPRPKSKAAMRREASARVLAAFRATGKTYTCSASVDCVRDVAIAEAKKLLAAGTNLSKSDYAYAVPYQMADMLLNDVAHILFTERKSQNARI